MYKSLHTLITHLYLSQVPATGIGLFRLLFGIVTFQEIIFLLYFNHLIFDPIPYLDVEFPMIPFFLCFWGVIASFIVLGYRCQQSIIINYIFWIIFVNFTPMQRDFDGGFDLFMIGSNFFLIFMPTDKAFSIDNLLHKLRTPLKHYSLYKQPTVSSLCYFAPLVICLGFLYFDSAIHKLFAPHWRNGLGAWLPASMPYYISPIDMSWFLNNEYLQKSIGYIILIFQFLFICCFVKPKLKPLFIIIGLGLHLGIILTLNIYPFGFAMLIFYVMLIPDSWYKSIHNFLSPQAPLLTVFYDQQCPLCCSTILTLNHFDIFNCIDFKGAQSYAKSYPELGNIPENQLLIDLFALDHNSKVYSGVDTYAQILIKMRYLAFFGYFVKLPLVYQTAKRIYRNIADTRTRLECNETCQTSSTKPANQTYYDQIFQPASTIKSKHTIHRICKILIIIFILQLNSTIHYGVIYRLSIDTNSNPLTSFISSISNSITLLSTTFLGITPHALYLHDHFEGYNKIIALTYSEPNEEEKWLPFVSPEGRLLSPNWGRVHSMWANIAVTPNIDEHRLTKLITKITAFWGIKSGLDLNNTTFHIKLKNISSPNTWSANLLSSNLHTNWTNIGTAKWQDKSFSADFYNKNIFIN